MKTATFQKYSTLVEKIDPIKYTGRVTRVHGLTVESHGPCAVVGELCHIVMPKGAGNVWAEVVGLDGKTVKLMPYDTMDGIEIGCEVIAMGQALSVPVSDKLLGRVLDSMGRPIDGKGPVVSVISKPVVGDPPGVLSRKSINEQMFTGIRAIDSMVPVGKGQRLGIFSGSGVGKSTLIGMIARNTRADINVIALIGERGREVKEFIENDLGEEGLKRSVVIVSTSNTPALARLRGAYVATTIAEYFRDTGKDVMFLFDSVTRFANAQREIGLAVGEPPATRGYTPSVFSLLPRLLERCATSEKGTITGFYTILVEGDDMDEPVSDAVRGILDGHMVLDRALAERGHFPAINILRSISRLAPKIMKNEIKPLAVKIREHMAVYKDAEDLINVGAYVKGTNPSIDEAVNRMPSVNSFLKQGTHEKIDPVTVFKQFESILGGGSTK